MLVVQTEITHFWLFLLNLIVSNTKYTVKTNLLVHMRTLTPVVDLQRSNYSFVFGESDRRQFGFKGDTLCLCTWVLFFYIFLG